MSNLDDIETIIANAKEKRKKAETLDAISEMEASGMSMDDQASGEAKHLAKTAQNVTDAMHTSLKSELVELHSFIPKELLPSVYEIALIAQAGYKEQRQMTRSHILDPIMHLQNEMIVQEMLENARILMRQLAALNGFRAIQGEHNINSLVGGVTAQLAANQGLGLGMPMQQKGFIRRAVGWLKGS